MTESYNIKENLNRLEKLMYGHNYEVTIGVDIFENCPTIEIFQKQLSDKYEKVKPQNFQPILFNKEDFWTDVKLGLEYRGDNVGGLKLTPKAESDLLKEQQNFTAFINYFISEKTKFYSYPEDLGMTGYIVYWGFTFLLLNPESPSLLIYGSASD
jgi:hypothetical protein